LDEKPPEATSSIIATGIYILPPVTFSILEKYCREGKRDNMGSFVSHLLEKTAVLAFVFNGKWMDIGDEIGRGHIRV
jgi:NDP-sugar pyrophosphorylase family protein